MNRKSLVFDLDASIWELLGFLNYLIALTIVLGFGFAWSLRWPEFALSVLPIVCLAILWDDQRREVARHAMPTSPTNERVLLDPLWDREIDA